MKKIEVGKSYKTRNGREVRIYTLDGIGLQAIHGAIFEGTIGWYSYSWDSDGSYLGCEPSDCDIVIPPLKYEGVTRIKVAEHCRSTRAEFFVPYEFEGLEVKFTLEVLDEDK